MRKRTRPNFENCWHMTHVPRIQLCWMLTVWIYGSAYRSTGQLAVERMENRTLEIILKEKKGESAISRFTLTLKRFKNWVWNDGDFKEQPKDTVFQLSFSFDTWENRKISPKCKNKILDFRKLNSVSLFFTLSVWNWAARHHTVPSVPIVYLFYRFPEAKCSLL